MKFKKKLDIDFYTEYCEEEFKRAKMRLMDDCGYSEESANLFLENLYEAVSEEYGN